MIFNSLKACNNKCSKEATTWLNGHEYELEKDLVRPILDLSFETVKDASSVKDIETTRTALNHLFDKMSNLTKKVPPGIPEALRSRITGVFMNRNRKFKVVGGPNATDVVIDKEDLSQSINMPDQPFDPIRIIEIKNYA